MTLLIGENIKRSNYLFDITGFIDKVQLRSG